MQDNNQIIKLFPGEAGVEAFYTQREAALPYPVIQGHQVHGSRVAIVERPGMTREELDHAGWKGTVLHISEGALEAMGQEFGSRPAELRAVIGPSIGPDSFQVGEEVAEKFKEAGFPMDEIWSFRGPGDGTPMSGGHHIDLWKANRWLLEQLGIPPESIEVLGIDTYTTESLFSARREGVACGRIINSIMLK